MKKTRLLLVLAAVGLLAGCNTVAGVGEDVSASARTVQGWL
ncbi:entericidin EcnA/B family protein [Loktanella sp. IMCC34160]|nr:entericidin EcnA/B family protein [Loktanella sp. IMCC34160]RYG92143.1 entericidin EcnA/B family protein [Loktanella sp. IMCC34160]